MNTASLVPLNIILSDIATKTGDREFRMDSEGYYKAIIQEAMQELSIDTLFSEQDKVYDLEDGCLKLDLPSGAFNVIEIFGFSGDECNTDRAQKIWWKRGYRNNIARDNWQNSREPFYKNRGSSNTPNNLFYCGISNGVVHLSSNCKNFEKIMIRYNGLMGDIGEEPIVPIFFRQAIVDYSVVQVLLTRIASNPTDKALSVWQFIYGTHETRLNRPYTGSWEKALHRSRTMDTKSRNDLKEYFSRLGQ